MEIQDVKAGMTVLVEVDSEGYPAWFSEDRTEPASWAEATVTKVAPGDSEDLPLVWVDLVHDVDKCNPWTLSTQGISRMVLSPVQLPKQVSECVIPDDTGLDLSKPLRLRENGAEVRVIFADLENHDYIAVSWEALFREWRGVNTRNKNYLHSCQPQFLDWEELCCLVENGTPTESVPVPVRPAEPRSEVSGAPPLPDIPSATEIRQRRAEADRRRVVKILSGLEEQTYVEIEGACLSDIISELRTAGYIVVQGADESWTICLPEDVEKV